MIVDLFLIRQTSVFEGEMRQLFVFVNRNVNHFAIQALYDD